MIKKGDCFEGQISLDTYLKDIQKKKCRQFRKKCMCLESIPFYYVVFQKAYRKLKENGEIIHSEILEQVISVKYEIYEALYLKALKSVYCYCCMNVQDKSLIELLPDMYEKEFEWMEERIKRLKI